LRPYGGRSGKSQSLDPPDLDSLLDCLWTKGAATPSGHVSIQSLRFSLLKSKDSSTFTPHFQFILNIKRRRSMSQSRWKLYGGLFVFLALGLGVTLTAGSMGCKSGSSTGCQLTFADSSSFAICDAQVQASGNGCTTFWNELTQECVGNNCTSGCGSTPPPH